LLTCLTPAFRITAVKSRAASRFAVIADDLTGAMDTGVTFARMGLDTVVSFGTGVSEGPAAVVVTTDSRASNPGDAYDRVRSIIPGYSDFYLYKKIDSTLRGNVGRELQAIMEARHPQKVVVCPAFPENKRTVLGGSLLVDGTPVDQTYFANDPLCPISEAHIPTLLGQQLGVAVGHIDLPAVEDEAHRLWQQIRDNTFDVLVLDATERRHLSAISRALALAGEDWLPCGSAGLASELPAAFGHPRQGRPTTSLPTTTLPVLLVAGSRNEVTARQLQAAQDILGIGLVSLDLQEFISRKGRKPRTHQLGNEVAKRLAAGETIALTSTFSAYVPSLSRLAASIMASIAVHVLQKQALAGLVLTGGDVARALCESLQVTGIRVLCELQPGIAVGELVGGTQQDLKVVTKAGGFGNDHALADAIRFLGGREQ
ncbi:MAG: four-carbon acid sugar kinase family protein, partial [Chloroflexota bacterium]